MPLKQARSRRPLRSPGHHLAPSLRFGDGSPTIGPEATCCCTGRLEVDATSRLKEDALSVCVQATFFRRMTRVLRAQSALSGETWSWSTGLNFLHVIVRSLPGRTSTHGGTGL